MLTYFKVKTDNDGKQYVMDKKQKVLLSQNCIANLPKTKSGEVDLVVNPDGSKFYKFGFYKIWLGKDRDRSRNLCKELEKKKGTEQPPKKMRYKQENYADKKQYNNRVRQYKHRQNQRQNKVAQVYNNARADRLTKLGQIFNSLGTYRTKFPIEHLNKILTTQQINQLSAQVRAGDSPESMLSKIMWADNAFNKARKFGNVNNQATFGANAERAAQLQEAPVLPASGAVRANIPAIPAQPVEEELKKIETDDEDEGVAPTVVEPAETSSSGSGFLAKYRKRRGDTGVRVLMKKVGKTGKSLTESSYEVDPRYPFITSSESDIPPHRPAPQSRQPHGQIETETETETETDVEQEERRQAQRWEDLGLAPEREQGSLYEEAYRQAGKTLPPVVEEPASPPEYQSEDPLGDLPVAEPVEDVEASAAPSQLEPAPLLQRGQPMPDEPRQQMVARMAGVKFGRTAFYGFGAEGQLEEVGEMGSSTASEAERTVLERIERQRLQTKPKKTQRLLLGNVVEPLDKEALTFLRRELASSTEEEGEGLPPYAFLATSSSSDDRPKLTITAKPKQTLAVVEQDPLFEEAAPVELKVVKATETKALQPKEAKQKPPADILGWTFDTIRRDSELKALFYKNHPQREELFDALGIPAELRSQSKMDNFLKGREDKMKTRRQQINKLTQTNEQLEKNIPVLIAKGKRAEASENRVKIAKNNKLSGQIQETIFELKNAKNYKDLKKAIDKKQSQLKEELGSSGDEIQTARQLQAEVKKEERAVKTAEQLKRNKASNVKAQEKYQEKKKAERQAAKAQKLAQQLEDEPAELSLLKKQQTIRLKRTQDNLGLKMLAKGVYRKGLRYYKASAQGEVEIGRINNRTGQLQSTTGQTLDPKSAVSVYDKIALYHYWGITKNNAEYHNKFFSILGLTPEAGEELLKPTPPKATKEPKVKKETITTQKTYKILPAKFTLTFDN